MSVPVRVPVLAACSLAGALAIPALSQQRTLEPPVGRTAMPLLESLWPATALGVPDGEDLRLTLYESDRGTDQNGDGDLLDHSLAYYLGDEDRISDLLLPFSPQGARSGDTYLTSLSEADLGQDRNGDGDQKDDIAFLCDVRTAVAQDLGIATTGVPLLSGDLGLFLADETADRRDWNGDGDMVDVVPLLGSLSTGQLVPIPLSVLPAQSHLAGDCAILAVPEDTGFLEATDVNGDGDTDDVVFVVLDLAQGRLDVVPIAVQGVDASQVARFDDVVVTLASEAGEETDISSDGDTDDLVPVAYDLDSGTRSYLRVAVSGVDGVYPSAMVFQASEPQSGGVDFNSDGDGEDDVLMIYDADAGLFRNLGLIGRSAGQFENDSLLLCVQEDAKAGGNNDGDQSDHVIVDFSLGAGTSVTVPLAVDTRIDPVLFGGRVYLPLSEQDENTSQGGDLNHDGDTNDAILVSYDLGTGGEAGLVSTQGQTVQSGLALAFDRHALDWTTTRLVAVRASQIVGPSPAVSTMQTDGSALLLLDPGDLRQVAGALPLVRASDHGLVAGTSDDLLTAVVPEPLVGDINGDGDRADDVLVRVVIP